MISDIIRQKCKNLEQEHGIKILFAVENGSRAWNLESTDSDYDVRFVYIRPKEEYLTLTPKEDVICAAYDQEGNPTEQEGCFIDMVGFDIFKFCKLLSSSNPTVIEWIVSPIRYYGDVPEEINNYIAGQYINYQTLYHHYRSMCRENYLKYIHTTVRKTTHKNYMYSLRGLFCAKFVTQHHRIPPPDFFQVMEQVKDIPSSVLLKLQEIIALKKQSLEADGEKILLFDAYIEAFLKDEAVPTFDTVDRQEQVRLLNHIIRTIL